MHVYLIFGHKIVLEIISEKVAISASATGQVIDGALVSFIEKNWQSALATCQVILAGLSELGAGVRLREPHDAVHIAVVEEAAAQPAGAHRLEPLQQEHVGGHEELPRHRLVRVRRHPVVVHVVEQRLERLGARAHDVYFLAARRSRLPVAVEKGVEPRGLAGEHEPVRLQEHAAHVELDVELGPPAGQEPGGVLGEAGRRHRHLDEPRLVCRLEDADGAAQRDGVVVEGLRLEPLPRDEAAEAPAVAGGVELAGFFGADAVDGSAVAGVDEVEGHVGVHGDGGHLGRLQEHGRVAPVEDAAAVGEEGHVPREAVDGEFVRLDAFAEADALTGGPAVVPDGEVVRARHPQHAGVGARRYLVVASC